MTIQNNTTIPEDEKGEGIGRYLITFLLVLMGEVTLHYIKLRSISDLIIKNVLLER